MPESRDYLVEKLNEIEERIRETRDRLPAHSVKPPIMMELLGLEDEAHAIRQKLETMKSEPP